MVDLQTIAMATVAFGALCLAFDNLMFGSQGTKHEDN